LSEINQNVSRRKFMAATSAAVAVPILASVAGNAAETKTAETTTNAANKQAFNITYYINDNCILCPPQPCKSGCPVKAISFDGDKFAIDPNKCIRCGNCSKVCEIGAVSDINAAPACYQTHDVIHKECDFLVLGGGASGIVAAAIAADLSKKKVIVIEKAKRPGGSGFFAAGIKMWSTKWQLDAGQPDQMDDFIRSAMSTTRWELNPQLVANAFRSLPKFFDWFCTWTKADEIFQLQQSRFSANRKAIEVKDQSKRCRPVMHKLIDHCKEIGVEILTEHTATEFIMGDHGEIAGVRIKDPGGFTVIKCKYALVSTGNVINCGSLITRSVPQFANAIRRRSGHMLPTNTGDGVLMAEKAGIPINYDNVCVTYTGANSSQALDAVRALDSVPESLYVNLDGKRWTDEAYMNSQDYLAVLLRQPRCAFYNVLDSKVLVADRLGSPQAISTSGNMGGRNVESGVPDPTTLKSSSNAQAQGPGGMGQGQGMPQGSGGQGTGQGQGMPQGTGQGQAQGGQGGGQGPSGGMGGDMPWMNQKVDPKELEKIAKLPGRHVCIGNTLEELADNMGVDRAAFVATVKRYNELCAKGHDEDFFKPAKYMLPIEHGPFYATSHVLGHDGAVGGLDINEFGQIMGKKGAIENLYASGDTTSSRFINRGGERIEIINDMTWAVASGFLAGEHIGKRLKKA
jgi:succinate dehydrogenase/fumarate reductase flavoprotein subunit